MGYASDNLVEMKRLEAEGKAFQVEVPGEPGMLVWVKSGQERYDLQDGSGRSLRISWLETFPPKPGRIDVVPAEPFAAAADTGLASGMARVDVAVGLMQEAARQIANAPELSPRDRNAVIGALRNAAAMARGFDGLVDWPSVPFGAR
jgi:hypothetical protein